MGRSIKILSTRPLEKNQIELLNDLGIELHMESFIDIKPIRSASLSATIESVLNQRATVVFTSMNAVEIVANHMYDNIPDWRIFCIGSATQYLVEKYFGRISIAGTAPDALSLAKAIVLDTSIQDVYFFCGSSRRDELPLYLAEENIKLTEIVIYDTVHIHHHMEDSYDGILFFSPSAVESFFATNQVALNTVLFAIGNTTAKAIRQFTNNSIELSSGTGKEEMMNTVISYFKKK